jgi:hypothetical protein
MITTGSLGAWRNFHFKISFFSSLHKPTNADRYVGGLCFCFFFYSVKCGLGFLARKLWDVDEEKVRVWNISPREVAQN